MTNDLSVSYFRSVLDEETEKLNSLCKRWEGLLEKTSPEQIGEENVGDIRAAIGLAHLLVNQRFKQFSGLIKNCEDKTSPKGFWEMIYYQVKDIYNKFEVLDELKL